MSEEEEIKKAKKDKKHFATLYEKYYERIYVYILSYVKNKENAEDIASLTFEKALKGIDSFQWEGINLQSWLYRIARNNINDFFRKRINRTPDISMAQKISREDESSIEDVIESGDTHIEVTLIKSEEEDLLYSLLMYLDETDQYLLYYKYFENMTNKDIAKMMQMSETNVGTKLQRIREKIKKYLKKKI